ncbi:hypothetical protein E2562_019777 [Oryza meyeriana var. granulata]|uniref:TCP domain-containing protein n=1 Tax=Oryza meyeriana var. granulata TaxID=110450 RepID=A0A6G1DL89_9ORYZ|nr:hypothetical protein E2562_019777 [Oryza meyeriana var. granulata]
MLPYLPNPHHFCISQEVQQPNPTGVFPIIMPPGHLDQHQHQHYDHFFSGHGQFNSETLEARPFRTDRHSKIRTAQGVRDRRMRLSLDVARDFFALQDRLGFDKASKTVDWLLTQSKPAIDRLVESSSSHRNDVADGDTRMSSPTSVERGDHHMVIREAAGAGSGKGGGDADKVRARGGRSVPLELGCELGRLVPAPVLGDYYLFSHWS